MKAIIFRSFLLTTLGLFILISLSACTPQSSNVTPQTPPPSSEPTPAPSPEPETPDSQDTDNWETYTSNEYGFQIQYPPSWKLQPAGSDIQGVVVAKGSIDESQIGIFPQGEFDMGLPQTSPTITDGTLAGKKVKIQRWDAENGATLMIYYFMESGGPDWKVCGEDLKNCNRIQVLATSKEDLATMEKMLESFKFL